MFVAVVVQVAVAQARCVMVDHWMTKSKKVN